MLTTFDAKGKIVGTGEAESSTDNFEELILALKLDWAAGKLGPCAGLLVESSTGTTVHERMLVYGGS